jgi:hypothetical protein
VDKKEFDERVLRLQDVGKVLDKLPAEIRSEAFGLLKEYVSGRNTPDSGAARNEGEDGGDSGYDANLFSQFDHDKPSDNVRLIAAYLFQQYGAEAFSVDEMKAIAAESGITVPARIDMTLRNAQENGKHLFLSAGNSKFKPTVHGESHLKEKYGVKKGTKKREDVAK